MDYRVILYHEQATSARTRYLKFSYGSVYAVDSIPRLAQLMEGLSSTTILHPAAGLNDREGELGFAIVTQIAEAEYRCRVKVPGGLIQKKRAKIYTMDPLFERVEKLVARFIDLTQAMGCRSSNWSCCETPRNCCWVGQWL